MERKRKKTEIQKIYNTNAKHSSLDTPCHFVIYGKHAIYFTSLKSFIDIVFVKTI